MKALPKLSEIKITTIYDRGVPNKECVTIQPQEPLEIAQYAICLGIRVRSADIVMPTDSLFWFGEGIVGPEDVIFLWTGSGTPWMKPKDHGSGRYFFCYWGKPTTMLHDPMIVPFIFKFEGIYVPDPPPPLLQR
jgi:hypothetical protein